MALAGMSGGAQLGGCSPTRRGGCRHAGVAGPDQRARRGRGVRRRRSGGSAAAPPKPRARGARAGARRAGAGAGLAGLQQRRGHLARDRGRRRGRHCLERRRALGAPHRLQARPSARAAAPALCRRAARGRRCGTRLLAQGCAECSVVFRVTAACACAPPPPPSCHPSADPTPTLPAQVGAQPAGQGGDQDAGGRRAQGAGERAHAAQGARAAAGRPARTRTTLRCRWTPRRRACWARPAPRPPSRALARPLNVPTGLILCGPGFPVSCRSWMGAKGCVLHKRN